MPGMKGMAAMSVDELFLQAARLPPDMQKELPQVVAFYRRFRDDYAR